MAKRLTYSDAVKLLGGTSPMIDNLLGGALSIATAGGSDVALSWFDAKAEMTRLGQIVTGKLRDSMHGYGRYDRNQRLQAAHGILVVTSFFEAFDEVVRRTDFPAPELARDDQVMLATGSPIGPNWLDQLTRSALPVPSPERPYGGLLADLEDWYRAVGGTFFSHLRGLAEWDRANDRARLEVLQLIGERLPRLAVSRYEEAHRRLAVDIPEFAVWMQRAEAQAVGRGLEALETTLARVTSGSDPDRLRASLAAAYRDELERPILGSGDAGALSVPRLGEAYVDSRFQVKAAGPSARPADEQWWNAAPRTDLADFLAMYLTTPQAASAPLLLLGHPGAGKSALTRILAARLPASDFLAVRVVLREVPAEAEIQDQIEQALRSAIGRTVSWPDLAENAGEAMPVVMLDGFDELLQATGIHQSDYLQRVAEFQRREAVQKRPVAVIVTSRVAVADRARLPEGGLAVRLEPFDHAQVAQWLTTWNATNAETFRRTGARPLPPEALRRFPDLAGQPLLLLMLALYDAGGNALQSDDGSFGTTQLYERLLTEFAAREVRRLHRGRPDAEMPGLIEEELTRLSIMAFAMFNRSRQWVTEQELDADLAALRIAPSRTATTEAFRGSMTAGQELVGRFFFLQRAQAVQDNRPLQTYEFLHATFGEYLVARLLIEALRDAATRAAAGTLFLRSSEPDDGLLGSLLGYLPLTARHTVLSFTAELLAATDRSMIRGWLVGRVRQVLTDPNSTSRASRPSDRRIDHWMATYSLNLFLLALACGGSVRATELFPEDAEPAGRLRRAGLVWRGSSCGGNWMDVVAAVTVTRTWTRGRRDLVLALGGGRTEPVDPLWSHLIEPGTEAGRTEMIIDFSLTDALTSMHLTNNLSDDAMQHVVQPLIDEVPESFTHFVVHGPGDMESIGHSLTALWLTSSLRSDPAELIRAYQRAISAITRLFFKSSASPVSVQSMTSIVLQTLLSDIQRLPPETVIEWLDDLTSNDDYPWVQAEACLRAVPDNDIPGYELLLARFNRRHLFL